MTVTLANRQKRRIKRRWLEQLAEAVMAAEGCHPEAELSIVIGDDEWIQELNRTYRKKDRPTDVLAFPQDISPAEAATQVGRQARRLRSQGEAVEEERQARRLRSQGEAMEEEGQARRLRSQGPLLGDVAVSAETAARQAEEAGHSFEEELALLVTHGILHLTGWSDETAEKRRRMMQRALALLEKVARD